jgi:hypothetical protein
MVAVSVTLTVVPAVETGVLRAEVRAADSAVDVDVAVARALVMEASRNRNRNATLPWRFRMLIDVERAALRVVATGSNRFSVILKSFATSGWLLRSRCDGR